MIIVKLMGGLGNQMFEYACGRGLSIEHQVPLKLDLSYLNRVWLEKLKGNPIRSYSLGVLKIQEEFARSDELPPFNWFPGTRLSHLLTVSAKLIKPTAPAILREVPFAPEANLANLKNAGPHTYLDGYWQNAAYFKGVEEVLRCEFTPRQQLSPESQKLARIIKNTNAISVHIRREDYVNHPAHSRFLGALESCYYQQAVGFVTDKVSNPHFFIFGDDLTWARQNLTFGKYPVTFIEHNLGTPHYFEDLRLMSLCAHNIIANSSFSWWGAWLNQNPQKIVIAPKRWFRSRAEDGGMVPKTWIRL